MKLFIIPKRAAQVGNRSEDAACSMAAQHGHSKVRMQDTRSADCGPLQPPIPNTTSPRLQNIYLQQQRRSSPLFPLNKLPLSWTSGGGGWQKEVAHEAGHGNVYVSWRSLLTVCFSAAAGSHAKPATNTALVLSSRLILHPLRSRTASSVYRSPGFV